MRLKTSFASLLQPHTSGGYLNREVPAKSAPFCYRPYSTLQPLEWEMAPNSQAPTQGAGFSPNPGLQGAQAYLIFLRSPCFIKATGSSRKISISSGPTSRIFSGQTSTHFPQPLHLSVSIVTYQSLEPSLKP